MSRRIHLRFSSALPLLLLLLLLLLGCAVNPVTGARELVLMSPEREAQIGKEAAAQAPGGEAVKIAVEVPYRR